ncbi:hypothetical protein pEaSNUABM56_00046 [Erwinia phage pEa_SNUABM_56]|uniref:Uncharacterized protein n=1 Tax=Erwinia phage pEp_SNUABM_01 TaxID=2601643 RepID=A0A5J6DBE4_9CAUD|nr:methyltransferase [Erwinia phage pEp_SNUABM_01]QEQ94846.1 hypothetical protein pEpSNUABM01_020 [Erwinia phage pEp_SNUABM_01]UYL85091.1 hypothetical protein pEaSNUABM56_00046 [Erwinia phage pEa_SNUABM_56]
MKHKAYVLSEDYPTSPSAKAGAVVYHLRKSDFGLARDDTEETGIQHSSVTLSPEGDYPSFTYPTHLLREVVEEEKKMSMSKSATGFGEGEVIEIGGKRFAGTLVNARPFVELWPRCIYGFLAGRDFKGRGFDNGDVRTSTVQKLHIENGKLYAITLNSAYCLASVDLMKFLNCPEWLDDIEDLIGQAVIAASQGV